MGAFTFVVLMVGGTKWLAGRDSNPDKRNQNPLSCHWTTRQQSANYRNRSPSVSRRSVDYLMITMSSEKQESSILTFIM